MEILLLIIGAIFGGFISWLITDKYYKKSSKDNEKQNNKLFQKIEKLEKLTITIPEQLLNNMSKYIVSTEISDFDNEEISSNNSMSHASYTDINNDGIDELIIQFPIGTHGYALQVYSIKDGSVKLLAEHGTDTPIEFEFEDINNDGKLTLRSVETNISSGYPYVMGIRDIVWYQLVNNKFIEIKREEPSKKDIEEQVNN